MATATTFYDIVDKIKEILLEDDNMNTVTYGDITKVATEKTTIYPLGHMVVNSAVVKNNIFTFSITVACMDIIDQSNIDKIDNEMDIFNTQFAVISRLILKLRRYNMRNEGYQIVGEPSTESFTHRFEDDVAGWDVTFDVNVVQDMSVC